MTIVHRSFSASCQHLTMDVRAERGLVPACREGIDGLIYYNIGWLMYGYE